MNGNFISFAERQCVISANAALTVAKARSRQLRRKLDSQDDELTGDEIKIKRLCDFLDTRELPVQLSTVEKDFYKRLAEKQVAAEKWPQGVLDFFDE